MSKKKPNAFAAADDNDDNGNKNNYDNDNDDNDNNDNNGNNKNYDNGNSNDNDDNNSNDDVSQNWFRFDYRKIQVKKTILGLSLGATFLGNVPQF